MDMKTLTNITLTPVIDFHPHYVIEGEDSMIYTYPSTNEERYDIWKKMMISLDLERLEPVRVGMEKVKITAIDEYSLAAILELYFEGYGIKKTDKDIKNHFIEFYGGVILYEVEELLISPQCCIGFNDYKEWIDLKPSKNFKRIWVGHPWIYYKTKDDNILLTEYIEKDFSGNWQHHHPEKDNLILGDCTPINKEDIDDSFLRFSIKQKHFDNAVAKMMADLDIFKQKIINVLTRLGYKYPTSIANTLIGKYCSSHSPDEDEGEIVQ